MARNREKRMTGLNRFLEAKQKEEAKEKDKKRPPLYQLGSAEEVKKWIPSIIREIEYTLQQISGAHASRNYQDHKIEEFKVHVDALKKEHGRFVAKVRTLDPSYRDVIPWEPRGYHRKRSRVPGDVAKTVPCGSHVIPPEKHQGVNTVDHQLTDKHASYTRSHAAAGRSHGSHTISHAAGGRPHGSHMIPHEAALESGRRDREKNVLKLDYSSSESSNEDDRDISKKIQKTEQNCCSSPHTVAPT